MSLEDNKAVIRRLYDAFNTVDLKAIDEALAADVVDLLPLKGQASGVEGFKERLIRLRKSFPDLSFTIETMIAEGDGSQSDRRCVAHTLARLWASQRQANRSEAL